MGCESSADPYAMESDPTYGHFPLPDGQESLACTGDPKTSLDKPSAAGVGQNVPHDTDFPVPSAEDSALSGRRGEGREDVEPAEPGVAQEVGVGGRQDCPRNVSAPAEPDYRILGTISPLSSCSKLAVKRSVGPVDEVSFVFGRPSSPSAAAGQNSALEYTVSGSGYSRNRCLSPSGITLGSRGFSRRSGRPRSPSSDVLPQRRGFESYKDTRRVLSPPPALGLGSAAEARMVYQQGGAACCESCNGCLVELKRQALRLMFPDTGTDAHLAQVKSLAL